MLSQVPCGLLRQREILAGRAAKCAQQIYANPLATSYFPSCRSTIRAICTRPTRLIQLIASVLGIQTTDCRVGAKRQRKSKIRFASLNPKIIDWVSGITNILTSRVRFIRQKFTMTARDSNYMHTLISSVRATALGGWRRQRRRRRYFVLVAFALFAAIMLFKAVLKWRCGNANTGTLLQRLCRLSSN